jgi:hypothetical protein
MIPFIRRSNIFFGQFRRDIVEMFRESRFISVRPLPHPSSPDLDMTQHSKNVINITTMTKIAEQQLFVWFTHVNSMSFSFPGFPALVRSFHNIFEVPTTIGFQLSHSFPVRNDSTFRYRFLFPPIELISVGPDSFQPSPKSRKLAECTFTLPFRGGTLAILAGTDFRSSLNFQLSPICNLTAEAKKSAGRPFGFSVGVSGANGIANINGRISRTCFRVSGTAGAEGISAGVSAKFPSGALSGLIGFPCGGMRVQAVGCLDKRALTVRAVNERFGIGIEVSQTEVPFIEAAWRLRINECTVHSSVDTRGFVKSFLGTRINSKCTVGFYAELSHMEETYRSGLSLDFDEKRA